MIVVKNNAEALGHYGLTMTLLADHDPYDLTTVIVGS